MPPSANECAGCTGTRVLQLINVDFYVFISLRAGPSKEVTQAAKNNSCHSASQIVPNGHITTPTPHPGEKTLAYYVAQEKSCACV